MSTHRWLLHAGACALASVSAGSWATAAQTNVITVPLEYHAPGPGPKPNFSPAGTRVALSDLPASQALPEGAVRPARKGTLQVGPSRDSWIPVLATASAAHPSDLTQVFIDANRNGNFADDGPAASARPSQNDKTRAWWTSFNGIELSIRYEDPDRTAERFLRIRPS